MAATPESKVKAAVVEKLKAAGAYYFFASQNGYGRAGVPDIIACYKGFFLAIECKAGANTLTTLQRRELLLINDSRGIGIVVNEDNISDVDRALSQINHRPYTV